MLDLVKARKELNEKSYCEIQESTGWTWASRAIVSYENVLTADDANKLAMFLLGVEYGHEAVEHMALVEIDGSELLEKVQMEIGPYASKAQEELERVFGI